MSAVTSSKWFENQFDLEPYPDLPPTYHWASGVVLTNPKQFGKNTVLTNAIWNTSGTSFDKFINQLDDEVLKPLLHKDFDPPETKYRENPPHSMAPHPRAFHFDRRGRKLY